MIDESDRVNQSPFDLFDPDRPGWLHRRSSRKEDILPADVARILEQNPELLPDIVIRDLAVRGLRGELKAKRGRKPRSQGLLEWRLMARYADLVEELLADKPRTRRTGPSPAAQGPSPMELIHAILAKEFKLGGADNVRNLISSLKNRQ